MLADQGNADAQFELGAMFHDGDGAPKDYTQALSWYTLAAKAGNRQAMVNLGLMYKNGEGTDVDLEQARTWFVKASAKGDVRAAFQLGSMSYLTKDFPAALKYFLASAKGGYSEAQLNVGVMNVRAEGMEKQNVVEGYAWLTLAKHQGNAKAASLLESLVSQMTAEQKTQGDARAAVLRQEVKNAGG